MKFNIKQLSSQFSHAGNRLLSCLQADGPTDLDTAHELVREVLSLSNKLEAAIRKEMTGRNTSS